MQLARAGILNPPCIPFLSTGRHQSLQHTRQLQGHPCCMFPSISSMDGMPRSEIALKVFSAYKGLITQTTFLSQDEFFAYVKLDSKLVFLRAVPVGPFFFTCTEWLVQVPSWPTIAQHAQSCMAWHLSSLGSRTERQHTVDASLCSRLLRKQSRFLFLPQVHDASPRVITQALALDVRFGQTVWKQDQHEALLGCYATNSMKKNVKAQRRVLRGAGHTDRVH